MTLHGRQEKEDFLFFAVKVIHIALKGTAGTDRPTNSGRTKGGAAFVLRVLFFSVVGGPV